MAKAWVDWEITGMHLEQGHQPLKRVVYGLGGEKVGVLASKI